MEEKDKPWNSKVMEEISLEISLLSHSIFAIFIALCALLLIYLPNYFFRIGPSPLLISTTFLLVALFRLGAAAAATLTSQTQTLTECCCSATGTGENRADPADRDAECVLAEKENDAGSIIASLDHLDLRPLCDEPMGWSTGASLEVIYEEYEGEEEEEEEEEEEGEDRFTSIMERYPSLSLYYPETDSEESSNGEIVAAASGKWDWLLEDEMIEIALNRRKGKGDIYYDNDEDEDENLIEIDIFSAAAAGAGAAALDYIVKETS